ncbi:Uncharacterised protein [Vibrio cholerae]|nr:Uncharacterised protein [Vibrio cholerae]
MRFVPVLNRTLNTMPLCPPFIFRPTMVFPRLAKYLNTITPVQATQTEDF